MNIIFISIGMFVLFILGRAIYKWFLVCTPTGWLIQGTWWGLKWMSKNWRLFGEVGFRAYQIMEEDFDEWFESTMDEAE